MVVTCTCSPYLSLYVLFCYSRVETAVYHADVHTRMYEYVLCTQSCILEGARLEAVTSCCY